MDGLTGRIASTDLLVVRGAVSSSISKLTRLLSSITELRSRRGSGPALAYSLYSPNCVEGVFCELPLYGVLRSSHAACSIKARHRDYARVELTLLQAGVPPDLHVAHQRVAHRAAFIRLLDGVAELLSFHARHPAPDIEIYACDSHVVYVEGAHGAYLQPLGRRAALGQNV